MPADLSPAVQGEAPFVWNKERTDAAKLVAEDELTDTEIAAQLGCSRMSLYTWKRHAAFQAKVKEHLDEMGDLARRYLLGKKARRLRRLSERAARLDQVIEERAADPKMQGVPGGKTGLLVRDVKVVGAGDAAQLVELYVVDTPTLKELREIEAQAAKELGQLSEAKGGDAPNVSVTLNVWDALATAMAQPVPDAVEERIRLALPAPREALADGP